MHGQQNIKKCWYTFWGLIWSRKSHSNHQIELVINPDVQQAVRRSANLISCNTFIACSGKTLDLYWDIFSLSKFIPCVACFQYQKGIPRSFVMLLYLQFKAKKKGNIFKTFTDTLTFYLKLKLFRNSKLNKHFVLPKCRFIYTIYAKYHVIKH